MLEEPGGVSPAVAFAAGAGQHPRVIASVQFKHFKALRATSLHLEPFNLVIGPNGSGKTTLIQAFLKLRALAGQPAAADAPAMAPANDAPAAGRRPDVLPQIVYRFTPPHADLVVQISGRTEHTCDFLQVRRPDLHSIPAETAIMERRPAATR